MPPPLADGPIGILDSGVGGLSVLRHVQALLPNEDLIYFADQSHVPYGPRSADEILRFSAEITRFLLAKRCKLIVVACNTASAAALTNLRVAFPSVPFVGMEPAVKPGAVQTQQGKIGILATVGTFGSQRYASLMARYIQGVVAFEDPCPGLVEQVETGQLDGPRTERILQNALNPMLAAGVDILILGCTHYPFVLPLIRCLVGSDVVVIDPAPAVAQQVQRLLRLNDLRTSDTNPGNVTAYTTGDPGHFGELSARLLGFAFPIKSAAWHANDRLLLN